MMMTPTTITLRRPSGDADLILNKPGYDSDDTPSDAGSYHSVPIYGESGGLGAGSRCVSPDPSLLSSPSSDGSPPRSPSSSRSRTRTDFDRLVSRFRRMKAGLRGSAECLFTGLKGPRCSWRKKNGANQHGGRKVTVQLNDYIRPKRRRGARPRACSVNDLDWVNDIPQKNLSTSMTLTNISNGVFTAEIPTSILPAGDITIRVTNSRIEIFTYDHTEPRKTPLHYCGSIDLPIYVDSSRVRVDLDVGETTLVVEGRMKGYFAAKSLSVSAADLRLPLDRAGRSNSDAGRATFQTSSLSADRAAQLLNTSKSWPNFLVEKTSELNRNA